MSTIIDITIDPADEGDEAVIRRKLGRALRSKGGSLPPYRLVKRSIDARHGRVRLFLRYEVGKQTSVITNGGSRHCDPEQSEGEATSTNDEIASRAAQGGSIAMTNSALSVVIVGTGPAALFAAFTLLDRGVRPILVERGERTTDRKRDIAAISQRGVVDADSNYCFGEGGAGTFSDGKLFTRNNKGARRAESGAVLAALVEAGADERILTDSHPHIGTDRLPGIVTSMVDKIVAMGGEVRFHTRCTGLITSPRPSTGLGKPRVLGITTQDTHTGAQGEVRGDAVILATGHSATDVYDMLYKIAPNALEAKGFAVGVRVEHPRAIIDGIQYHGKAGLSAAEYRLTSQVADSVGVMRGVYSFCMCPGGFVVPAATGPGEIVVNGMSASGRNSQWSNAAIVMEVRAEDLPGDDPLRGLKWRTWLEREAYNRGDGVRSPAQRLTDFLAHRPSTTIPRTSYTPGVIPSRLDEWLPAMLVERLTAAFHVFDSKMRGFITEDALIIAPETRTSSPVRILRDPETMECPSLPGLFAAGEGAGYAGGIVSSAMDGQRVAEAVAFHVANGKMRGFVTEDALTTNH